MEDSKSRVKEYVGNYGQHKYILLPIPEHPRKIVDRYGWEWLYLGRTDEWTARVAKANPNGSVAMGSCHHMSYDCFPCFDN